MESAVPAQQGWAAKNLQFMLAVVCSFTVLLDFFCVVTLKVGYYFLKKFACSIY